MCRINKYDVVWTKFEGDGAIQTGYRPAVIIQNDIGNRFSPTLIALPLTTKIKGQGQATHCLIKKDDNNGLQSDSMLLAEQITTVNKNKVRRIGRISDRETQKNIFKCFIYSSAYGDTDVDLKELNI